MAPLPAGDHACRVSPALIRSVAAEFLGTFLLVLIAVGSAVAGIDSIGPTGVALAFGLTLLALAYALGPVSGCHINPAVTLAVLLSRGMTGLEAAYYWAAQFAGAIAGAAVLKLLTSGFGNVADRTGALGANDYGESISAGGAFLVEVLLTFAFVAVILLVTGKEAAPGVAGLAIGLALAAVHLVGIPLTGTSVNPARSLGPALFAGGEPLAHVWLFLVAPLVGAALAFAVVRAISGPFAVEGEAASASDRTDVEVSGTGARRAAPGRTQPATKNSGKRRGRR